MKSREKPDHPRATRVVGTVHSIPGLRAAARLRPGSGIDLVEARLDFLADTSDRLAAMLADIRLPILLTVRHPREGGNGNMTSARRRELLQQFLPSASMIDVELRSAGTFRELLIAARRRRVETVLSFHDFKGTPTPARLRRKQREAALHGSRVVCKIACQLRGAADLARLLLVQTGARGPLATMGMGPLGKISRLLLPLAGSRLAYGYIDRPQVPGQWPAELLARRLREVAR